MQKTPENILKHCGYTTFPAWLNKVVYQALHECASLHADPNAFSYLDEVYANTIPPEKTVRHIITDIRMKKIWDEVSTTNNVSKNVLGILRSIPILPDLYKTEKNSYRSHTDQKQTINKINRLMSELKKELDVCPLIRSAVIDSADELIKKNIKNNQETWRYITNEDRDEHLFWIKFGDEVSKEQLEAQKKERFRAYRGYKSSVEYFPTPEAFLEKASENLKRKLKNGEFKRQFTRVNDANAERTFYMTQIAQMIHYIFKKPRYDLVLTLLQVIRDDCDDIDESHIRKNAKNYRELPVICHTN